MPKRRAISIDSDEERISPESSATSKRVRREDDSDVEVEETSRQSKRGKGKNKAHRPANGDGENNRLDDDDEDDLEQTTPDQDEEKRFEEEHEEEIREKLMSKGNTQGGIAEMGIIESLEMHQFMCHKYLTFTFGPQINFIIGHNGSGKSAVLSALTVALGGKANSTGRGSGLKSFIREGQSVAEVTVVLKNQGEEAYRPKEYGKSIVITRRFTKEGSSSYKIKSKDGRVISTKREELSAICDHMNIQVDNPMNILTQDAARQFLSASQPADKYKFFLRGTQLSQLSEEYQICLENIGQTQKVLKRKSEAIPELEEALEEATSRFQEAAKAREQRHKADELKKELAWAHVATKERELKAQMAEVLRLERRLPKIKKDLTDAEQTFKEASDEVEGLESDLTQMGEIEHLMENKQNLQEQIRENRTKIAKLKEDETQMNQSIKNTKKQIARLEEQIKNETERLEQNTQAKRDETNRKLEEAKAEYEDVEHRLQAIRTEKAQKSAEAAEINEKGKQLDQERNSLRSRVAEYQGQLERCAEREKNKLAPFGRDMDRVLHDIQCTNWYGSKPVGPLGLYVNVKDPDQWASLMRVQLGGLMSAFAVTDPRDRLTLDKILKQYGNACMIIIAEVDLFDYSRGEPPPEVPTVLRTLDVSDPYVLRILINQAHIEGTVIAPTRREADSILQNLSRGGLAWSADLYRVQRFAEGGGSSNPLAGLNRSDPRHQLFTGKDAASAKRHWQDEVDKANNELRGVLETIGQMRPHFEQLQRDIQRLSGEEARTQQELRSLKTLRDTLQEDANEETPVEIQGLEKAKEDMEAEKELTIAQFKAVEKNRADLDAAQNVLMQKLEDVKRQINDFEGECDKIRKKIEEAAATRLTAQHDMQYYTDKLKEEEKKVNDARETERNIQTEFESWTAKAEEYCERWPNPRPADDVKRNLDAVQAALREREKRHGASVEEMTVEVNKKKAALDTAKKDLKNMLALNKALKRSIKVRLTRWHEFRRHIALRCKVYFQYHLSNRGYYGKVLFDHVHGSLQLKVQTDDQTLTQNNREKDPRSLSGGEKSFSTICLLLSLWESIGCPIRCLDEFDVFMDAVNRRISMRMMIDTANSSDRKQYVLITPQDMTNINIGNTVRVHRMTDPERGQGVLAFS